MAIDSKQLHDMLAGLSYKESQIEGTIQRLRGMDPELVAALETWMQQKIMPEEPVYHGLTPRLLEGSYPLKPPAVFLLMDWIRRDPGAALQALEYEYGRLPKELHLDEERAR